VYPMDFAVARSLRVRPGRGRLCAGLPAPDSGRARVSGPRTDSTEGLPRFGTARRASPPPSVNVRARLLPRTQHAERFSVHPDNRLTCVTRANRETCGRAGGEVGRPVPSSGWLCAGLPTPHKFDRRSPAIRYCARSLTRPSVNLRARLLPRTQHNRTLFRLPRRQTHLRHEGEQGDLRSCQRRGRETCAEQRSCLAVRGSPDPAQIRPKVSRDSVLREKPHPALCESESASLATDAAQPNAFQITLEIGV
jgi:hypothetical protein